MLRQAQEAVLGDRAHHMELPRRFSLEPFHPKCVLVRLNLPEELKDTSVIAVSGMLYSKTSLLLWSTNIIP